MCIPQHGWTEVILPLPAQAHCSGRGGEIEVAYIHCINSREPEDFELSDFAEDEIRKIHSFARVQISDDFTENTFYYFLIHDKSDFFSRVAEP